MKTQSRIMLKRPAAVALALSGILSCHTRKESPQPVKPPQIKGLPASSPQINITVQPIGSLPGLRLGFCFDGNGEYDPQVVRISITNVQMQEISCTVSAIDSAWLWKEWVVGTAPPGFRLEKCKQLVPGEYEIYVSAIMAKGVRRLLLDNHGSVKLLPWSAGSSPPEYWTCPANTRDRPRVLDVQRVQGSDDGDSLDFAIHEMGRDMKELGHLKGAPAIPSNGR
jgi:hypothetical protein